MTLARAILVALDRVQPFLMPEVSLWQDVNLQLHQPVTHTELRSKLNELEGRRLVVGLREDLDGSIKWRITENGRAVLLQ